jgi:hypothetical protein
VRKPGKVAAEGATGWGFFDQQPLPGTFDGMEAFFRLPPEHYSNHQKSWQKLGGTKPQE